mmetsp:Transcript_111401/g.311351  ORF Transcript_111401/g.311351 Transcript_111401/m.311351 type:complete len:256 (+) Transcript_111401:570-1337(+)
MDELELVEVRDDLDLHGLAQLDLALQLCLQLRALVHELAVHGLVLRFYQGLCDGLQLVQVHRVHQLVLRLLNHVLDLRAPRHRLLLLCGLRRLVHMELGHGRLAEAVQRLGAQVAHHCGRELLLRGLASLALHGLLQQLLHLRHGAQGKRCVAAVVLGEDVDPLGHEALGAIQRASRRRLMQRGVAYCVPLVVRQALPHQQPQDLQVALEGRPMEGAVLLLRDLALRLVVLVHLGRALDDEDPRQNIVAVVGRPD